MKKTYSFQPILNIGDLVYIINPRYDAPNGYEVIRTKIDNIRCFCSDNTIEYSTEDSEHFEGLGWYHIICFSEHEIYGAKDFHECCHSDIIFLRKEDAEKAYGQMVSALKEILTNED